MKQKYEILLKCVFVGDSGVGKTSLLRRQTQNTFTTQFLCTIGVDFKMKVYHIGKMAVKMQYWDTAGQERFRSIQKPYYKGSHVICLCFDLSKRESFDNLTCWMDQIAKFQVKGTIYLVGCKSDLDNMVPTDEILNFAEAHQMEYMQTSSKLNEGIQEGFASMVEKVYRKQLQQIAFDKLEGKEMMVSKIEISNEQKKSGKIKSCC